LMFEAIPGRGREATNPVPPWPIEMLPDPDHPEGAALLRRLAEEHALDEWASDRSPWEVARAIEERCAEHFGMVDQTMFVSSNFGQFLFYRVTQAEQARRRVRVEAGWRETAVERDRWIRERRPPADTPGLSLYICHGAPFAAVVPGIEGDLTELMRSIREELEVSGWQLLDQVLLAKRVPADLEFESLLATPPYRVFDVLFFAMD